jgi:hypothetical protein
MLLRVTDFSINEICGCSQKKMEGVSAVMVQSTFYLLAHVSML